MPIYEYECRKCKAHIEILQKITDPPLAKCRKCGGKLEKQWSATSFQFKGTGWYVTDYAGKKSAEEKKSGAAEPAAASATTANAASTTTDTSQATEKPASKKSKTNSSAASSSKNGGD